VNPGETLRPAWSGALPPQGTQASVQCTATATTNAFDPSVTSSTGDPWLRATESDPPPLHPLVLQPGETGTIDVGFAPSAAPGWRVTGFLSIDTYDSVTHFGTVVREIPYAYRVG
jgi:hypothetical protein